ncbi:Uncharacterised protein [Buttiauxella agrestis]|uniref:Uncharacterized protein n=1 Tax=Buttiauxella agrestis TaxID=82977 RepID=A0A381KMX5_9ENTR|nr:hypothetical protein [Buttiauxella agrestis]SUY92703.1 Uncharacterised protein [Buttiauxella agrestis]
MMKEGFYWIRVDGQAQIGRYVDQMAEYPETGEMITGAWELVGIQSDVMNTRDVEVLSDLLTPP